MNHYQGTNAESTDRDQTTATSAVRLYFKNQRGLTLQNSVSTIEAAGYEKDKSEMYTEPENLALHSPHHY